MAQVILTLILVLAIIGGGGWLLNSCTSTLADSAERIATVNNPMAQAEANTAKLLGEVQAQAEAIRVEVLARGQAELEIERARAEQAYTLQQAHDAQEADHAGRMLEIEAESKQRIAEINAKEVEATARASVAWVGPFAEKAVIVLGVFGLVTIAIVGALTIRRVASAWATKIELQATVPLTFHYDKNTLTAPIILALVDGKPVLANPNTGEVLPLSMSRNAEGARLRYLAAQNAIALQTRGNGARDGLIIPDFAEDEASNGQAR